MKKGHDKWQLKRRVSVIYEDGIFTDFDPIWEHVREKEVSHYVMQQIRLQLLFCVHVSGNSTPILYYD